jgi:L-seryl-tRNA(Ser) seleniumtransferase
LPLKTVVEIAHSRNVPVIVDAASTLPPRSNFTKHIEEGADLVQFSGGKGVRGPQGTGILLGKKEFVEAAYANASPHQFIGRGMKVAKEEIIGLVEALRIFLDEDENEQMQRYQKMCEKVLDAFVEVPGLKVEIKHDEFDYLVPTVVFTFTKEWTGLERDVVLQSMEDEDPRIFLWQLGNPDEIGIEPLNLDQDELDIVIEKLRTKLIN